MTEVRFLPPAAKFLKKLKDKKLKALYQEAIDKIREDHTIGEAKVGDLSGIYSYDIYYNKTNYELAYRVVCGSENHNCDYGRNARELL